MRKRDTIICMRKEKYKDEETWNEFKRRINEILTKDVSEDFAKRIKIKDDKVCAKKKDMDTLHQLFAIRYG